MSQVATSQTDTTPRPDPLTAAVAELLLAIARRREERRLSGEALALACPADAQVLTGAPAADND